MSKFGNVGGSEIYNYGRQIATNEVYVYVSVLSSENLRP
jgi:hypothetical protein